MLTLPNVPTDRAPSRAIVVVIDPEPLYRWFVSESLGACEIAVVAAASIEDAAAYLRHSGRVDLVIADGELVLASGQSLRTLRERAGAAPLLVLDPDGDLPCHGVRDATVVAKPVDSAVLARLVTSQLRRRVSPT